MYKIRLLLADPDSKYVDKLTDFITNSFAFRIRVSSFTRENLLKEYLQSSPETIDILLANQEFLCLPPDLYAKVELVVQLSDGSLSNRFEQYRSIYKFQSGHQLVNQLLNIYSEQNSNASKLVTGSKHTKLVSVYAPCGGVGKTSIVLGLAVKLSEMGFSVLVLGLESINSLVAALSCTYNDALTHILLALSENSDTLPVKVETFKTRDTVFNLDFIEPPDCFMELSELKNGYLVALLEGLKQMGKYDIILTDMDSVPDNRAFSIFESSDRIVFVQVPECNSRLKTETFLSQVRRSGMAEKTGLFEKLIPVINKYQDGPICSLSEYGLKVEYSIPLLPNLWVYGPDKCLFDSNRSFSNCLTSLAQVIV